MAQMERSLADFIGSWSVSRQITHHGGPNAQLTGTAVWRLIRGGALYHETGQLKIAGQGAMTAEQRYIWRDDLSVWFDETRFFHNVPVLGGAVGHFCSPDQYDGTYDFSRWPVWSVTWDVSGPRKAYRSVTSYRLTKGA